MGATATQLGVSDLTITLRPVHQAASIARLFVRHKLICLGQSGLIDDALQITSELVANAVTATRPPKMKAHGRIRLRIGPNAGRPLLEVWDSSPELPVIKQPDFINETGRGLYIVKHLAADFGWVITPEGGKTVWALLV
jgi:signal transduction histidine kinase